MCREVHPFLFRGFHATALCFALRSALLRSSQARGRKALIVFGQVVLRDFLLVEAQRRGALSTRQEAVRC